MSFNYARANGRKRHNTKQAREAEQRRAAFAQVFVDDPGATIKEACAEVGIHDITYYKWRSRFPEFATRVDALRSRGTTPPPPPTGDDVEGTTVRQPVPFVDFRQQWLRTATPWFQIQMVEQYETMPAGHTVLILVPPEHGKTTLFEDYCTWRYCFWPDWRNLVVTKSQPLGRKMAARVKNRLDPDGPFPDLVRNFGPFTPQRGESSSMRQTWAADRFSVYLKRSYDERSYNFEAIGTESAAAGLRADQLHLDDVQELKSLGQTRQLWDNFTQDWISRPGPKGRTSINMTRVGVGDFAEELMTQWGPDLLTVIKFPAIVTNQVTGESEPLWPYDEHTRSGFTMEDMELMRKKVGPEKWGRNYMQEPIDSTFGTFTSDIIAEVCDPLRSVRQKPDPGARLIVGLDPAIGSINAFVVAEMQADRLIIHRVRADHGLARNEQIMQILEELVIDARPGKVRDVVIEAMAFQRGLSRDQRLVDLSKRHRFTISEHLTGANKYDENIGIASMADSFLDGEIVLPYAEDDRTRHEIDPLINELLAWKPMKRGTQLQQDRVMALWFCWIRWRNTVRGIAERKPSSSTVRSTGTPWKPTPMPGMTRFRRSA